MELDPAVLAKTIEIADKMHRDPADQLIVATALVQGGMLMTDDRAIRQLGWIECI